jgi:hypothetical protein
MRRAFVRYSFFVSLGIAVHPTARAQDVEAGAAVDVASPTSEEERDPIDPLEEGVDPTRLDVERLPIEAIEITRDLYSHGLFVEGWIGGRGFQGGVGRFSDPGLYATVALGLEIIPDWVMLLVAGEASIHATDAPAPPSPTVFELLGAFGAVRLQVPFTSRFALWGQGEGGIFVATGDVLPTYGFQDSEDISLMFGASGGIDWHLLNRHYSMGILGGARLYPNLNSFDGEVALGIHLAAYFRYVF